MQQVLFFDFDLYLPVEKRWGPIFDKYEKNIPTICAELNKILEQFGVGTTILKPLYNITPESNIMFYDEIRYIAKRTNMDPFHILLMQLIYETSSACTAAVLNIGGKEIFIRTMDWPMPFLKDITIGLNIIKRGKHIAKVTTWLGYIGFLTATNIENDYTIAINYRRTAEISIGTLIKNLYRTVSQKWPVGYLIRYVIENNFDYDTSKDMLIRFQLISPCYMTLYRKNGSNIITRDCDSASVRNCELIQTNCDWNKTEPNILWSLERVSAIKEVQKRIDDGEITGAKEAIKEVLKFPVMNEETIYVHIQYDGKNKTLV